MTQPLNSPEIELFGELGKDTRQLKRRYLERPSFP